MIQTESVTEITILQLLCIMDTLKYSVTNNAVAETGLHSRY